VASGSHRKVLEPIARNVGIRRIKSQASWVLSTNTDMLFQLPKAKNLIELLHDRKPSLLTLFRNEIPEYFWDSFDRMDVSSTDRSLRELSKTHLTRHILIEQHFQNQEYVMPDAVGDFQLAPSNYWNQMGGFPEDELLGWHNDTRLALQMAKKVKCDIEILDDQDIVGFHQNHYRSLVEGQNNSNINDSEVVFKEYNNGPSWGLGNEFIEKISLDKKFIVFPEYQSKKSESEIPNTNLAVPEKLEAIHAKISEDYRRMIFFIRDDLVLLEENSKVLYLGVNEVFFETLRSDLGTRLYRISLTNDSTAKSVLKDLQRISISKNDLILIDLGIDSQEMSSAHRVNPQREDRGITAKDLYFRQLIVVVIETIPLLGEYLHTKKIEIKVGFLRNQTWPTLLLTKKYFLLPLFNNYSGYLSGRVQRSVSSLHIGINQLMHAIKIYYLGNYVKVTTEGHFFSLALRFYKKFPNFLKTPIHKIVLRFYKN
jgi:hypothetical protein